MRDEMAQAVPKTLEANTNIDLAGFRIVLGWNLALPRIRTQLPPNASPCVVEIFQYMQATAHNTLLYTLPEDGFILKQVKEMACEALDLIHRRIVQRPRSALLLVCPDNSRAYNIGSVNAHNLGLSMYVQSEADEMEFKEEWPGEIRLLKATDFRSLIKREPDCLSQVLKLTEHHSSF